MNFPRDYTSMTDIRRPWCGGCPKPGTRINPCIDRDSANLGWSGKPRIDQTFQSLKFPVASSVAKQWGNHWPLVGL